MTVAMNAATQHAIRDLCLFGQSMDESSTRSLELLRDIERVLLAVGRIRDDAASQSRIAAALAEGIRHVSCPLPETGLEVFERVQSHLEELHTELESRYRSAKADAALTDEDGVRDCFREAMAAVCDWHEALENLRWAVMHHNALLDGSRPGPALQSAADIDAFLASL